MAEVSGARMRYSFESKLRAVRLVEAGMSVAEAARRQGAARSTVQRWWRRFRAEGAAGLRERSSRPRRSPRRLAAEAEIAALRLATGPARWRWARCWSVRPRRSAKCCCGSASRSPNARCGARSCAANAGELLHVDIKKLGRFHQPGKALLADPRTLSRGAGWQFLHVAVDDHSRLAYAEVLPSERAEHAVAFLARAVRWYAGLGLAVEQVMTDNGACYASRHWAGRCRELGLRHLRTRPCTPRTNGKAERLIGTMLRSWARAFAYRSSAHRAKALAGWLRWYNRRRPTPRSAASRPPHALHTSVVSTPSPCHGR